MYYVFRKKISVGKTNQIISNQEHSTGIPGQVPYKTSSKDQDTDNHRGPNDQPWPAIGESYNLGQNAPTSGRTFTTEMVGLFEFCEYVSLLFLNIETIHVHLKTSIRGA